MKNVLILTNSRDEHAHLVVPKIEELGGKVFRIDTDRLATHFSLTLHIKDGSSFLTCKTPVGNLSSNEISSLWIRRPYYTLPETTQDVYQKLIQQETFEVIRSLPDFFNPKTLIVDLPEAVWEASRKILQLKLAKKLGLTIPNTLITTSETEAKQFIDLSRNGVVIKAIDRCFAAHEKKYLNLFTSKLDKKIDLSLVKNCPTLFQENIKKKKELRITIIGRKIFAVEFDSQKLPEAQVDWRKAGEKIVKVPHRVVKLPSPLEKKLLALLDFYGLNFGAIDMAKIPEGEYIFFELNPAGQFLWLEDVTSLPLALEMAKFLLGEK